MAKSFPMDLSKFKKVGQDKTHTTLKHPEGHEIRIAHAAVSPKMRGQLAELPMAEAKVAGPAKAPPSTQMYAEAGEVGDGPTIADVEKEVAKAKDSDGPVSVNLDSTPPADGPTTPTDATAPDLGDKLYGLGDTYYGSSAPVATPPQASNAIPQDAPPPQTPQTGTAAPQAPAQDATPPSAAVPQDANQPPSDPYGAGASYGLLQKGLGNEIEGIRGEAGAQGAIAKAQAASLQTQQVAQQQAIVAHQQRYNALNNERQAVQKDVLDHDIDPTRYWGNLGTRDKVASTIGIVLGGIGGALTHQANPVMAMLQQNIDRDIAAQRANLDSRQTLLGANLRQFGNERDATDMTKVMMNDHIATQLQLAAAKSGSQLAQARAQQGIGQLQAANSQIVGSLTARQSMGAMMNAANNGAGPDQMAGYISALRIIDPERAKEMETRYVPGVGMAAIPLSQENRSTITERKLLGDNLTQLSQFQKKYGGTLEGIADPKVKAYGEALAKQVQDQYRRANAQGVFKPAEAAFVNGVVADSPSSLFSKYTKAPAYKAAQQINQANLNAAYQSVGLHPKAPAQIKELAAPALPR